MTSKCLSYSINAKIYGSDTRIVLPMAMYSIIPMLPVLFLTLAALLNLYNWAFYFFKIGQMASMVDSRAAYY